MRSSRSGCNKCMYNCAHGFLVQELSDSPDVIEMIVGVLAGFCDLHIHFQVGVKNHTRFGTDTTGVIWSSPTWMNEWIVCLHIGAAVYFLQSRMPSCCHSPLACWKSSSSSVLPHNFQWQWLRQYDSWKEWVWMTVILDAHWHSLGLLGGAFLWSGIGRQHRWWTAQGQGRVPVLLQWWALSSFSLWKRDKLQHVEIPIQER